MAYEEVRRIEKANGKRRLIIYRRADGLFCFGEEWEDSEDLTPLGLGVVTYWAAGGGHGLYADADLALNQARAEIPWLLDAEKASESP